MHRYGSYSKGVYMNFLLILSLLLTACFDDEINEQCILRAPSITLSCHRAMSNAKCERPRGEGGKPQRTKADNGADVLYGRPLAIKGSKPTIQKYRFLSFFLL